MPIVVSDTGPINYLTLIGHIQVLPVLFEKIIPFLCCVRDELSRPKTPELVRSWAGSPKRQPGSTYGQHGSIQ